MKLHCSVFKESHKLSGPELLNVCRLYTSLAVSNSRRINCNRAARRSWGCGHRETEHGNAKIKKLLDSSANLQFQQTRPRKTDRSAKCLQMHVLYYNQCFNLFCIRIYIQFFWGRSGVITIIRTLCMTIDVLQTHKFMSSCQNENLRDWFVVLVFMTF